MQSYVLECMPAVLGGWADVRIYDTLRQLLPTVSAAVCPAFQTHTKTGLWTVSRLKDTTRLPPARRAFKTLILTACKQGLNAEGQGESWEPSALEPRPSHPMSYAVYRDYAGMCYLDHVYNKGSA